MTRENSITPDGYQYKTRELPYIDGYKPVRLQIFPYYYSPKESHSIPTLSQESMDQLQEQGKVVVTQSVSYFGAIEVIQYQFVEGEADLGSAIGWYYQLQSQIVVGGDLDMWKDLETGAVVVQNKLLVR